MPLPVTWLEWAALAAAAIFLLGAAVNRLVMGGPIENTNLLLIAIMGLLVAIWARMASAPLGR